MTDLRWHETPLRVRLSEVDSFGVVWHGNYVKYFEVGRTDLAREFGLTAQAIKDLGYFPPVVAFSCKCMESAKDDDELTIRTRPRPLIEAAKISFDHEVCRNDGTVLARGHTTQVILDERNVMLYHLPDEIRSRLERLIDSLE